MTSMTAAPTNHVACIVFRAPPASGLRSAAELEIESALAAELYVKLQEALLGWVHGCAEVVSGIVAELAAQGTDGMGAAVRELGTGHAAAVRDVLLGLGRHGLGPGRDAVETVGDVMELLCAAERAADSNIEGGLALAALKRGESA